MFGFKKKQCSICQAKNVINVGKPLGHLCEKHMLENYKTRFLAHTGRKIIIPPTPLDKYTSYQFDTIASLVSYGWSKKDIEPIERLFYNLPKSECNIMQSEYKTQGSLDIDQFGTANWKQKTSADALVFILSALPQYMNSGGIALPPLGDENIIIYPLRS